MIARRWPRIAALAVAGVVAACSASTRPPSAPATLSAPARRLHDLRSIDEIAAVFDRDRAHPRIVLLLSPT
jgi:hypothetical protein